MNFFNEAMSQDLPCITVQPVSAILTDCKELLGRLDTYVVVKCGHQRLKTKTHTKGGRSPEWNDSLVLKLRPSDTSIRVKVRDTRSLKWDSHIGGTVIPLFDLFIKGKIDKEYEITRKSKVVGKIRLVLHTGDKLKSPCVDKKEFQLSKAEKQLSNLSIGMGSLYTIDNPFALLSQNHNDLLRQSNLKSMDSSEEMSYGITKGAWSQAFEDGAYRHHQSLIVSLPPPSFTSHSLEASTLDGTLDSRPSKENEARNREMAQKLLAMNLLSPFIADLAHQASMSSVSTEISQTLINNRCTNW